MNDKWDKQMCTYVCPSVSVRRASQLVQVIWMFLGGFFMRACDATGHAVHGADRIAFRGKPHGAYLRLLSEIIMTPTDSADSLVSMRQVRRDRNHLTEIESSSRCKLDPFFCFYFYYFFIHHL
ncbi:hypothetical protein AA313_de0202538 [Arthrobotrys entomopaga]|nr:hypothetical protein AA313_de0202538 [Arthrobotrys entomopaga]